MTYLLINPPSFNIEYAPIIGIPSLIGVLEEKNINAEYINLNAIHLNQILKENHYNIYYKIIEEIINANEAQSPIEQVIQENKKYISNLIKVINKNSKCLKSYETIKKNKNIFYNPYKFFPLLRNILLHLSIYKAIPEILLKKHLSNTYKYGTNCEKDNFSIDTKLLIESFYSKTNTLKDTYNSEIKNILNKRPKCISISINLPIQLYSGLYLAHLLKQKSDIHINIGGSFFESFHKQINNIKMLFGLFFDSIAIGDSTQTVLQLYKYINEEIDIEQVPNLLYLSEEKKLNFNNNIQKNFHKLPPQLFNGYKKDDYILPELVLPIQTTKSCYWAKCIYCSCSGQNNTFEIKPAHKVVEEIEFLSNKYKTKHFYFWDNSLPPQYIEKIATELIKRKINITYNIYARFDSKFDIHCLKNLRKSGCIRIHWGLDSASQKILDYIKKGINVKNTEEILKNAHKAGISNNIYLLIGLPTETISDIAKNIEYLNRNKKYIDCIDIIPEVLFIPDSIIYKEKNKYKELIKVPIETRTNIAKEINKKFLSLENIAYFFPSPAINLYIKKYGKTKTKFLAKLLALTFN